VYAVAAWRYHLGGLQAFVMIFAGVAVLVEAVSPIPRAAAHSASPLFKVHLAMAFAAYSLFTIAALHAVLIALAEKHLHKAVPPTIVAGLPPLLTLEKLLFRMIQAGFALLTLTLLSGVFFAEEIFGQALPFNHKTVFGLASWLIFAALLLGRRVYGWRGRTAISWTLAGFMSLLAGLRRREVRAGSGAGALSGSRPQSVSFRRIRPESFPDLFEFGASSACPAPPFA
jgi:ABC-type uncharacterized transport system permease subunit